MTAIIDRDDLLTVARQVAAAVQSRNTIPILGNVLLEVAGGVAKLSGTDLDCQVRVECPAEGELATTLPSDRFLAAAESLKPGPIQIAPNEAGTAVTLRQGRSVRTLPTLPTQDFPTLKAPEKPISFRIDLVALRRLIDSTCEAQTHDATRPYLDGIFFAAHEKRLRAAASDGHKMMRAEIPLPEGAEKLKKGIIVSSKAIGLIRKLLGKADGSVAIDTDATRILITAERMTISALLVEGNYPDLQRIIPADGAAHRIEVTQSALVDAASNVARLVDGDKRTRGIRIDLQPGADPELSTRDPSGNASVEPLPAAYEGPAALLGINVRYLLQIAGMFREASKLALEFADPRSPIRITAEAEPDLVAVCMPMNA
jgi:DNA polymerase-3 subunit beta